MRDDSTKNLYGPHSTFLFTEDDYFNNRYSSKNMDSAVYPFHSYDILVSPTFAYQDLGNLGTPSSTIYYQAPDRLGRRLGYNAFDLYAFDPNKIKYYDTRSPYSSVKYIQGSRGQQIINTDFNRNITKRWNAGFIFQAVSSQKLIGSKIARDPQSRDYSFLFQTSYRSKNDKYKILSNITFFDGTNFETGGIRPSAIDKNDSLFNYRLENVWLTRSRSLDKRYGFHAYQEYGIKSVKLFLITDAESRQNRFTSQLNSGNDNVNGRGDSILVFLPSDTVYYPGIINSVQTSDRTTYNALSNQIGVKGKISNLHYWIYYKRRDLNYAQYPQPTDNTSKAINVSYNENYIGGKASWAFNDTSSISFSAEKLLGRDYFIRGDVNYSFFSAGLRQMQYSPTLVQQHYVSNHFYWFNDFKGTNLLQGYAGIRANMKVIELGLRGEINNFSSYVYFDSLAKPNVYTNNFQVMHFDFIAKLRFKKIHSENWVRYSKSTANVIKVPEWLVFSRNYYQTPLFKRAIYLQVGVDLTWKSSYYANYYMPVDQQFYLNNAFLVKQYLLADIFINAQIKKFNFFIKMSNAFQGLGAKGYFVTPWYTGPPRTFHFGIKWMFFS